MSGYFGTAVQRRLQAQAEASVAFIDATPGACHTGRMMGCDDPDRLGWAQIDMFLERDGACGFRMIPTGRANELKSRLAKRKCRFDTWDVFVGDRSTALAASEALLSRPLPQGLTVLDKPSDPGDGHTARIQALMGAAGIVPFSGSFLTGALVRATTVAIGDAERNVVAVAHGYLPHNAHSPLHRYAWGGLVAVADAQRGKGLGSRINAQIVVDVFRELDATHVYELVSTTNMPSRRMVESCGLRLEPALVCGVATPNESGRFTR